MFGSIVSVYITINDNYPVNCRISGWMMICFVLLLQANAYAIDCSNRGAVGRQETEQYISNNITRNIKGKPYTNNSYSSIYISIDIQCSFVDELSARLKNAWEYSQHYNSQGEFEGKDNNPSFIYSEAFLSWQPFENLFFDIGKIDKKNGSLFAFSPMDKLRNITINPRGTRINSTGTKWQDFYSEGAIGINTTLYTNIGTFDFSVFPRISDNRDPRKSSNKWNMQDRTNNDERYAISFVSTGLTEVTPSISVYFGDQRGASFGINSHLTDNVLLTVEAAYMRQKIRDFDFSSVDKIHNFQAPALFSYKTKNSYDFGIGLRYMRTAKQEFGIEYYTQSRGYSRSEWNRYFDVTSFFNYGYIPALKKLYPGIPPSWVEWVSSKYKEYSNWFALETDNQARMGRPLGKHYITMYMSNNNDEIRAINFNISSVVNLIDFSSIINLHINSYLTENLQGYFGSYYSFGSENSEFGQFGEKGSFYVGLQYIW